MRTVAHGWLPVAHLFVPFVPSRWNQQTRNVNVLWREVHNLCCAHMFVLLRFACIGRRGNAVETDQQKIDFIEAAMDMEDPFIKVAPLDAAVESALGWLSQLPPDEVNSAREALICEIEGWGECLRSEGHCDDWLRDADPYVRQVAGTVNGPLLEGLAAKAGHGDLSCVEFFRAGATRVRFRCVRASYVCNVPLCRCASVWHVGALGHRCSSGGRLPPGRRHAMAPQAA